MKFVISWAIKSPCCGCTDRYIGCHSCCEKDKQYHEELYNAKRVINKRKRDESIVNDYIVKAKVKSANLRREKSNGKCRNKIWER